MKFDGTAKFCPGPADKPEEAVVNRSVGGLSQLRATRHNGLPGHQKGTAGRAEHASASTAGWSDPAQSAPLPGKSTSGKIMIRADMLPLSRGEIVELLHQADVMPTAQRIHIAEVMLSKPQHLSAEQVLERVAAQGHSISRATIYNTLGLFSDKGMVKPVNIDPDRVLYDSHTAPHHHFLNTDTGELIDIEHDAVELKNLPELPEGTVLANVDIVFELRQDKRGNGR